MILKKGADEVSAKEKEALKKHDRAYRALFEHKDEFVYFLKKYIAEPWAENINENDLDSVESSFITDEYTEIESDIIYKLRLDNGHEVYFYVLLELQSSVDYTMCFRLLEYQVALLRKVFYDTPENIRERKDYKLPAVIPLVFYNGRHRWTAVRSFREYTENSAEYGDCLIDFKYLMCDLNRTSDDFILSLDTLNPNQKATDCVFKLDKCRDAEGAANEVFNELRTLFKVMSADKIRILAKYLAYSAKEAATDDDIEEMNSMLKSEVSVMTNPVSIIADKARREGKLEALLESAINMIKEGFPFDVIKKVTKLPDDEIKRLMSKAQA